MHSPELFRNVTTLIHKDDICRRVHELGAQITDDYSHVAEPIVVIGILKGSAIFTADLVRSLDRHVILEFMGLSSYGDLSETSGNVRVTLDVAKPIHGRHVLVVEDIVDTGLTMDFLLRTLYARSPASVKICTLLHKPSRRRVQIPLDYVGFNIDDEFVIGYGLDHVGQYRNMPFIGIMNGSQQ